MLCSEDPILGGAVFNEREITISNDPGLGIHGIQGIRYLADRYHFCVVCVLQGAPNCFYQHSQVKKTQNHKEYYN